ncbi:MAG: glycoside hydrolase family 1 protein [Elusimicrobia bacterium]|nr:glycoside hydrolase family 1 protein [Elusimicrobiota bacterium]
MSFPKSFLWGASTSAYQIEGGNDRSALWDWEKKKGWERSGQAAGSWEKFDEDLKIIKALNLNAYRFSVEWSRVEPEPGRIDQNALERYVSWARKLGQEGIRPFVCLHHFSEPAWLLKENPRGWLDENVSGRFLHFATRVVRALSPVVSDWVTFNEPMVFLVGAYGYHQFPPGRWMLTDARKEFIPILVPNMATAHKRVYRMIHDLQPHARVGLAQNVAAVEPAHKGDEEAARLWDWFMHRNFLDLVKGSQDFLGLNYYTRIFVSKSKVPWMPLGTLPGYAELEKGMTRPVFRLLGGRRDGKPRTGMDWEVVPEAFGPLVLDYHKAYKKPVLILENGMAEPSQVTREEYLRGHLSSLNKAIEAGAEVRGYFHWSLLDNYEWGSFRPRFGLYTRDRRPADGADFYAKVAANGELPHG